MLWTRIAVAAVVLAAVVAYPLISQLTGHKNANGTGPGTGPSPGAHSTAPSPTHPGDLRKYLIAAPPRSRSWPNPLGTEGKLSLGQAVRIAHSSRATFRSYHFSGGAVRSWITASKTWVDVRLYRFGSASDAQQFFQVDLRGSSRARPTRAQSAVKAVPGARAFADRRPDGSGILGIVAIGVKGDVVLIADVAEHAHRAHLKVVNRLMRAEYRKL